ncbi:MAG: translation initiation factor IF-2 [Paludibacter sp.]|nr:translation initiation factor IF-2 [Bacteroidales bacterium]MCM1068861.1 translation initiation factor IF-2 [Prevotella sp.]MCM1353122.1 translation initiation factor IF-2 [Bacteroides sp.]MCM1442444.1 translation initiation factor IF-2 [Muribaculum sp.]MCM1481287.1 translation initiation factor IF-2 [Paludibacter sp.]
MAIKLIKACKELNIGMSTAVEFAQKQGKDIVLDPNARIDDETYLLLAKAFNKDMALKMEAERLQQERQEREKPQTVTLEPEKKQEPILVVQKPKVVGKINLDPIKHEAKTEVSKPEVVEVEPVQEEIIVEVQEEVAKTEEQVVPQIEDVKQQPVAEEKAEEPIIVAEEPVAQDEVENESAAEVPAVEVIEQPQPSAVKEEKEPVVMEEKEEQQQPVAKEVAAETTAKAEPEVFRLNKPVLQKKPVVVGTIDLDKINQSTHPKQKTKEQKKKEREERRQQQRGGNTTANASTTNGGNTANAADGKRKRERIKQGKVDVNNPDFRKGGKGQKAQKRPVKVEVDDEEVQKQIKETIARLQSGKGKNTGAKYRKEKREHVRMHQEEMLEQEQAQSKILKLTEFVTANELATMMNISVNQVIATCMSLGLMVSINQRLDAETINIVAEEFGFSTEYVSAKVIEDIGEDDEYSNDDLEPRCPIVTVMGHVDHGKTSLLDHIRNTNVIAGEAGGITQHIGAYNVQLKNGQRITFLDTPGHEAFTAMRARGAKVTDIAIIIVAADDAVMPQTIEAINHAQAAGVPMIFAINKCDKPGANPDKIKEQLSGMNILVEEWGGKYQSQDISAKKGEGVFELLEKVLLEAELLDLKANPKRRAKGSVIESSLDKGRGYIATILVQDGTLHMGDVVLAGTAHGKIKAMFNERNQRIKEVHPGEPVLILGLNGAPQAGDDIVVMPTEQEAREIANKREQLQREQSIRTKKHVGLEEIGRRLAIGDFKELNIIVKGDVDGSVEALSDSLIKLSTENIQVNVIHKAVGAISDSDILLAEASDAIVVGFQVRPTATARKLAEKEEIDIRLYSIIYDAIEEIKAAMAGMLAPELKEEVTATLEVRQTFRITKVGTVAGCIVREGKIKRGNKVRVIRDGIVIHTGDLASLKREKEDVREVGLNTECGLNVRSYNDIQIGDVIESFEQVEVKKEL